MGSYTLYESMIDKIHLINVFLGREHMGKSKKDHVVSVYVNW